ncbi:MAG: response regulator transcription factor [Chloroflexi bacterium]|nr:response regulator transcription factor [Chloroflexota bacterium]MCI0814319.1 response regulator transcription factor [Chloroflexota bacterium]MCI0818149.1 response regulator transcription factor [Chloroflexota bacterium]MCI0818980.1 response regulator transcription factor [Chloroflexota bacterium]
MNQSVATAQIIATKTASVLGDPSVWSSHLSDALESLGFAVEDCAELTGLFESAQRSVPGLVVIAQDEPDAAVRAARATRELQKAPIMVVMPRESDLIASLDAGADDAVISRVDPAVFAARVRALLRRVQPGDPTANRTIVRDLVIDFEKYQVTVSGEPVQLTPTEFRLLAVLAQQTGRVVDPRALLSAVHQHDYSERDAQNLVKVHIANLRRKLKDNSSNPYILCVRGFGYMLERRGRLRDNDPLSPLINED